RPPRRRAARTRARGAAGPGASGGTCPVHGLSTGAPRRSALASAQTEQVLQLPPDSATSSPPSALKLEPQPQDATALGLLTVTPWYHPPGAGTARLCDNPAQRRKPASQSGISPFARCREGGACVLSSPACWATGRPSSSSWAFRP